MDFQHGKFVWFDHLSGHVFKAANFYRDLFGWLIQEIELNGYPYHMISNGLQPIGGLRDSPKEGLPSFWLSSLSVDDVDARTQRAAELGATVTFPPTDLPNLGRYSCLLDPQQALLSLFKSCRGDRPDGPPALHEFCWNELWCQDDQAELQFYQTALDFGHVPMDMGAMGIYYLLTQGGVQRAGLMKSPIPNAPSYWLPYISVADCDATAAKAQSLRGGISIPPTDIPGIGRYAVLTDNVGAAFGIITSTGAPA